MAGFAKVRVKPAEAVLARPAQDAAVPAVRPARGRRRRSRSTARCSRRRSCRPGSSRRCCRADRPRDRPGHPLVVRAEAVDPDRPRREAVASPAREPAERRQRRPRARRPADDGPEAAAGRWQRRPTPARRPGDRAAARGGAPRLRRRRPRRPARVIPGLGNPIDGRLVQGSAPVVPAGDAVPDRLRVLEPERPRGRPRPHPRRRAAATRSGSRTSATSTSTS